MKNLATVLFITLISQHSFSKNIYQKAKISPQKHCIEIKHLRWRITQKVSKREYIMVGDGRVTRGMAVLKTKKASYKTTGIPVGINLRKVGSKRVVMQNGFEENVSIWEECSYDPKIECAALPPSMGLARPERTSKKSCYK